MTPENRREALAGIEGLHNIRADLGLADNWQEKVAILPTYDNETDLFRIIRGMDDDDRWRFHECLAELMELAIAEDWRIWQATTKQIQEAILRAYGKWEEK